MRGRGTILSLALAALPLAGWAESAPAPAADPATEIAAPDAPDATGADRPAVAPETLADLRARLRAVSADLQSLRGELRAQGAPAYKAAGGDKAIDRMNRMEAELARLTGETQRLQNTLNQALAKATLRLDDLEFRLCDLEEGCDLSALTGPRPADGDAAVVPTAPAGQAKTAPTPPAGAAAEPATSAAERADFDRAQKAFDAGDLPEAAKLFAEFAARHAGGPLTVRALYLQGAALDGSGDAKAAAEAWLHAYTADPRGPQAPDTLLALSRVVATVDGAADRACPYLTELTERFPGTRQAAEAARRAEAAGCAAETGDAQTGDTAPHGN